MLIFAIGKSGGNGHGPFLRFFRQREAEQVEPADFPSLLLILRKQDFVFRAGREGVPKAELENQAVKTFVKFLNYT